MTAPYPALTAAIRAIAEAALAEPDYDGVRDEHVAEALAHNDAVLAEWVQREGGYVTVLHEIADLIESQLDLDDRSGTREAALVESLAAGLPATTATLSAALLRLATESLRDEADTVYERQVEADRLAREGDPDARYEQWRDDQYERRQRVAP